MSSDSRQEQALIPINDLAKWYNRFFLFFVLFLYGISCLIFFLLVFKIESLDPILMTAGRVFSIVMNLYLLYCQYHIMKNCWPSLPQWQIGLILITVLLLSIFIHSFIGFVFLIYILRKAIKILKINGYKITLISARKIKNT